jgi:hypothetical protein
MFDDLCLNDQRDNNFNLEDSHDHFDNPINLGINKINHPYILLDNNPSTFENTFNTVFNNNNNEEPDNFVEKTYFNPSNNSNTEGSMSKKEPIFDIKAAMKKGRKTKISPITGAHNKKCLDNASNSIVNISAKESIIPFLQKAVIKFALNNHKLKYRLGPFKSDQYLKNGLDTASYYFESSPKELFYSVETKIGQNNKRTLGNLLEYELNNNDIKIKRLNLLFNAPIKVYEMAILNDEKYITIEDEDFYLGDDFKTLKDYFNEGNKVFTVAEKKEYKKRIINIIRREIHTRSKKSKAKK